MNEKVKNGGTPTKAPIGYLNIRRIDEKGREERTVILDEERAPLIKLAFTEYATGNWTIRSLAEHINTCGLSTRATPRLPSANITCSAMERILTNPYYKGTIIYNGVEYPGAHPVIVEPELWDTVQTVLSSHMNGERTREHPHFLKGSIFCGECGSRMIVTYAKNRAGTVYPYFVCSGRHGKRTGCKLKAILIEEVEQKIEQIYEHYSFPPEIRQLLEKQVRAAVNMEREKFAAKADSLKRQKEKLERKRKKLMESYYSEAIPLELLKSEQAQIGKQLAAVEREMRVHDTALEDVENNLSLALELMENCGTFYHLSPDPIKRLMNQAMVERFLIFADGHVSAKLTEPYRSITEPIRAEITKFKHEKIRGAFALTDFLHCVSSNNYQIFLANCLNNARLVDLKGFEPSTSRMRTERSPN